MASNQTSNYGLNQWEATDEVLRTEFNADNSKIDAALKGLADKDAELEGTLAGQAADIAKCGTCKFECFSYNGTGTETKTISFAHKPVLFLIQGDTSMLLSIVQSGKAASFVQGGSSVFSANCTAAWSGTQVTLSGAASAYQMNSAGKRYWVFALYQEV